MAIRNIAPVLGASAALSSAGYFASGEWAVQHIRLFIIHDITVTGGWVFLN